MKLIELKCNNCGANLKVNSELNEVYCNYCGNKMLIDDEATTIERVENAKIKSRKSKHEQDMREKIDNYEFEKKVKEDAFRKKVRISIVLGVISFALFMIGSFVNEDNLFSMFGPILGLYPIIGIMLVWTNDKK